MWTEYRKTRDTDLRDRLFEQYEGLAKKIAYGYNNRAREMNEFLSPAYVGLLKAIERYDPMKGKFMVYAGVRIKGAIRDYMREIDWMPRFDRKALKEGKTKLLPRMFNWEENDADGEHRPLTLGIDWTEPGTHFESEEFFIWMCEFLSGREKLIMHYRIRLGWTLKEIGKEMGLVESRIMQICHEVYARMRQRLRHSGILE